MRIESMWTCCCSCISPRRTPPGARNRQMVRSRVALRCTCPGLLWGRRRSARRSARNYRYQSPKCPLRWWCQLGRRRRLARRCRSSARAHRPDTGCLPMRHLRSTYKQSPQVQGLSCAAWNRIHHSSTSHYSPPLGRWGTTDSCSCHWYPKTSQACMPSAGKSHNRGTRSRQCSSRRTWRQTHSCRSQAGTADRRSCRSYSRKSQAGTRQRLWGIGIADRAGGRRRTFRVGRARSLSSPSWRLSRWGSSGSETG